MKAAPTPCAPRSRRTTTATPRTDLRRWSCRDFLDQAKKKLPELPEARRVRMIAEYDLSPKDAHTLTASREFADP